MGKLVNKLMGKGKNADACTNSEPKSKPYQPTYYNISVVLSEKAFNKEIGKYIIFDPYNEVIIVTESNNVDFGKRESYWQVLERGFSNKLFDSITIKVIQNEESKN